MGLRHFGRGFEALTFGVKVERLARIVGSHCFKGNGRVPGYGSRLLVLVMEKKSEAWRRLDFNDGDFNKAVTEVHEEAVVRSAFNVPAAVALSARAIKMAVAFAAEVLNHVVQAERLNDVVQTERQSPARDPRQRSANLAAQRDTAPSDQAVSGDQQDKADAGQQYRRRSPHGHGFVLLSSSSSP
jgi:hypothetical protein